jgi:AAA+ ATPase superfamily predicted ATPase
MQIRSLNDYFQRKNETKTLLRVLNSEDKSDLLYLRGRRRIGKSTLLKHIQLITKNVFYFTGIDDESYKFSLNRFVQLWSDFSKDNYLLSIKPSSLNWPFIFRELTKSLNSDDTLTLVFDEIQWIAKSQTGFIGAIKEAWLDWQPTHKVKIIICGSSNKFFIDYVMGNEKILRGLKTHADVVIHPFTLPDIKNFYFSDFTNEQTAFIYMCLGGIPYYLQEIDTSSGFVQAIENSVFDSNSIFLAETDEILNLDFNNKGLKNVKLVLKAMGWGSDQISIRKKTGLSESTVSEIISKLLQYELISERYPFGKKPIKNNQAIRYVCNDFYLNFYFQVLSNFEEYIAHKKQMLFPKIIQSKAGLYIENFTGPAFESLIRHILINEFDRHPNIFEILSISDPKYSVSTYWDAFVQYDLVIHHKVDNVLRIIECKWTSHQRTLIEAIDQVQSARTTFSTHKVLSFVATNLTPTISTKNYAKKVKVKIITLKDLF